MAIDMKALARVGAETRLKELLAEVAEIERMFPGLGGARRGRPAAVDTADPKAVRRGRRRKMSAAEKASVSKRMKAYWAARRKEKKAQK
jgi:hypothetical protein